MSKDKMGDAKHRIPFLVAKEHTVIVSGLKAANYMIENGSEMIGIEDIHNSMPEIRMIFSSENVHNLYYQAITRELPELTLSELDRLYSKLSILTCAGKQELKEEEGQS